MPRKTAAVKAARSTAYYKEEIRKAYETGELDAPVEKAIDWLRAALRQRAMDNPGAALKDYKHTTDQLSGYAEQLQNWIIEAAR